MPRFVYRVYERRRLAAFLAPPARLPRHIGVILDGNRRWAKSFGEPAATGHRRGADKIVEFLGWAEEWGPQARVGAGAAARLGGIEVVTLWMLSTDNLSRESAELDDLMSIISDTVQELAADGRWRLRIVGRLELLPAALAASLKAAAARTESVAGLEVNIAVGYGGRDEIADAVREYLTERAAAGDTLAEVAASIDTADIAAHLYTAGQPDPELVIRTSGEQRIGGFLMWQAAHSELYFCEVFWPDFRRVDFLRALRDFTRRERRLGR